MLSNDTNGDQYYGKWSTISDFKNIQSFVNHFDWPTTFSPLNVELAFNTFFDALHQSILRYVLLRNYTYSHFPPGLPKI
jgi:hypothetical protein